MQYRNGDQVIVEFDAIVVRTEGEDRVRISVAGHEIDTTASMLQMVRRSVHQDDEVVHDGARAKVIQQLESNVFLLNVRGAVGADAYRVAGFDEIRHYEPSQERAPAATSAPAVSEPAPASASTATVSPAAAPAPEAPAAPAAAPTQTAPAETDTGSSLRGGIGAMADSLTSLVRRDKAERRPTVDLESMGTTETVPTVGAARSELLLGDEERIPE